MTAPVDTVLISKSPGETRVALTAAGRLVALSIARAGAESIVGNIYLGRVESVVKGLDAAFVDIGLGRAGFLAVAEARPPDTGAAGDAPRDCIGDYVREGDAVLVQVQRDPMDDKGAKLTAHVNIAGANLVLRPGVAGVSVSRRITDESQRRRLLDSVAALTPDGTGFIVRTAAVHADTETLAAEAETLARRWAEARRKRANARAPACLLMEPGIACRALRDSAGGTRRVIVDDAETLNEIKAFAERELPALVPAIGAHGAADDLFEAHGVEAEIEAALIPEVALPGGGSLIISETPALTAIDVNSGGAERGSREDTAYAVDLEAAEEIARQLRLRNISGLIVVDFVPVRQAAHRDGVIEALKDAAAKDPCTPQVVGHTRLGLVEMTRRKHAPSLAEVLGGPWVDRTAAAPVLSPLSQALAALRRVLRDGLGAGGAKRVLAVPPAVARALKGSAGPALREAEAKLGLVIEVASEQSMAGPDNGEGGSG